MAGGKRRKRKNKSNDSERESDPNNSKQFKQRGRSHVKIPHNV